jgi:hypothetical protein
MTDLIQRLEAGTAEGQRELLLELHQCIRPEPRYLRHHISDEWNKWSQDFHRYWAMLDCGAYLDAVKMLVPRGWIVNIIRDFDDDGDYFAVVKLTNSFTVMRGCDPDEEVSVTVRKGARRSFDDPTALALAIAILKAKEAGDA